MRLIRGTPRRVLDVGCSDGTLGASIKQRFDRAIVDGVDADAEYVLAAGDRLDSVGRVDLNAEVWADGLESGVYDLVICADVLEHLERPEAVVEVIAQRLLRPGGHLITSVPHAGHLAMVWNVVLGGRWPRRSRGLFDVTHRRYFGRRDIRELHASAGLTIVKTARNTRLMDMPWSVNVLAWPMRFTPLAPWFTYQYLHLSRKG